MKKLILAVIMVSFLVTVQTTLAADTNQAPGKAPTYQTFKERVQATRLCLTEANLVEGQTWRVKKISATKGGRPFQFRASIVAERSATKPIVDYCVVTVGKFKI